MALPAVSEVFKGSIDESLKKLVQPPGIVPASILVLLNFAFIYPKLLAADVPAAQAFDALDDPWKGVVVSGLILVLGYVILNLNGSAMRLATGELIGDTGLGRLLTWMERRRIDRVLKRAEESGRLPTDSSRLPLPSDAAPTRLGNVFAGSNASMFKRYGFDMAALWAHLETIVASEDEALSTNLDDEYTGIQVLINMAVTALVIGAEAVVFTLVTRQGGLAFLAIASLPIAYGLYRAAAARARGYTDLVEVAVDLYRSKLGESFGIEVSDSPDDDKPAWVSLRQFLLWDRRDDPPSDPTAALEVSTTTSENVAVKALPVRQAPAPEQVEDIGLARAVWQEDYGFIVSAKVAAECCKDDTDVQLVLSAGKYWSFDTAPTVEVGGRPLQATLLEGGLAGDSLLIRTTLRGSSSTDVLVPYRGRAIELTVTPKAGRRQGVKASFASPPRLGATTQLFDLERGGPGPTGKLPVAIAVRASWMSHEAIVMYLDDALLDPALVDGRWVAEGNMTSQAKVTVRFVSGLPKRIPETGS